MFRKNLLIIGLTQYGEEAIRLTSSLVLARLLLPEIYGIMEIAMSFVMFTGLLKGFAIDELIVQKKSVNEKLLSTLFWANILLSVFAALMLGLTGTVASYLYKSPTLGWVIASFAAVFLIESVQQIHRSLIIRRSEFWIHGKIRVLSATIGAATAIFLAMQDYGIWSLVIANIVACSTQLPFIIHKAKFRPALQFDAQVIRDNLHFSRNLTISRFVGYVKNYAPRMILGFSTTPYVVGVVGMAFKLCELPNRIITGILNNALSVRLAAHNADDSELPKLYQRTLVAANILLVPTYLLLIIGAKPIVDLLLGENWGECVRPLQLLAPGMLFATLSTMRHRVLIAMNRTLPLMRSNTYRAIAIVACCLITAKSSLTIFCAAISLCFIIFWLVEHKTFFAGLPEYKLTDDIQALASPFIISTVTSGIALLVHRLSFGIIQSVLISFLVLATAYFSIYAILSWSLRRDQLTDIIPAKYQKAS